MTDEYKTISGGVKVEIKVRDSRFIALASPSITKTEAEEFIAGLRRFYHDATHVCYAYRCGAVADTFRFNDDGEPRGTAGKPILAAIERYGLTDIVVAVIRYFGGTKLGVGGLRRAYGGAAEHALASAAVVTKYAIEPLRISFPHALIGNVMHVASRCGAKIVDTLYDEEVHVVLEIRKSRAEELRKFLMDQTSGNLRFTSEGSQLNPDP